MATRSYQAAVERRAWLAQGRLTSYTDTLIDQGYDDLDSIRRCNQNELLDLLLLFQSGDDRQRARLHLDGRHQSTAVLRCVDDSESVTSSDMNASDSMSSTVSSHEQCNVRIRCDPLYQDEWVHRCMTLNGTVIWCFANNSVQ